MSDGMGGTKRMYVGRQFAGAHFADVMGNAKYDIKIDDEGCGEFYVNRRGLSVWIKKIANYKKVVYSIYYFITLKS